MRAAVVLMLVVGGCGEAIPAAERGRELFSSPSLSSAPGNLYACSTCHAAAAADGAQRHAGYPLGGAARRPSFWGGAALTLLEATNACRTAFLASPPLDPADEAGRALLVFLESLPGDETARPFTVVRNIDALYDRGLPAGDPVRGAALYTAACAPCHGEAGSGAGQLGKSVPVLPTGSRLRVLEKIRHGGFLLADGVMPPYSTEALADAEVADLIAFLGVQ